MANFAVLSGDIVSNVIVADTLANAEIATKSLCVEIPQGSSAGIGDAYNAETGKFIDSTPNPAPIDSTPAE